MNPTLSTYGFYLPVQLLSGAPLLQARRAVARYRGRSPSEREEYRQARLGELLDHLRGVPYYRPLLDSAGRVARATDPGELFAALPPLSKQALQDHHERMVDPAYGGSWRTTSGSTGRPLRFRKDRRATAMMDAVMHDRYSWHGIRMNAPQARVWGRALRPRARVRQRLYDLLLNRIRLSPFELDEARVAAYLRRLVRFRPSWFYAYPSALMRMVELAAPEDLRAVAALGMQAVVCTGEMLFPEQRAKLERYLGAPVVNEYGSTECGIIGFECPAGAMHVSEESLVAEVQDAGGRIGRTGSGDLLVTELASRSVPFVRYAVGDRVRLQRTDCACGRSGAVLEDIQGRIDSFIVTPSGARVYDAVLAYALSGLVRQFRATQESPESLLIEVVPDALPVAEVSRRLRSALEPHLGSEVRLSVRAVDGIPRDSSGKLRYFIPLDPAHPAEEAE